MATAANTVSLIAEVVDRLGHVKAQIAELKQIEGELTRRLTASGESAVEGTFFRATVSEIAERSSLDPKAAEAKLRELGVDGRWFGKHQKVSSAYVAVRVSARKTS